MVDILLLIFFMVNVVLAVKNAKDVTMNLFYLIKDYNYINKKLKEEGHTSYKKRLISLLSEFFISFDPIQAQQNYKYLKNNNKLYEQLRRTLIEEGIITDYEVVYEIVESETEESKSPQDLALYVPEYIDEFAEKRAALLAEKERLQEILSSKVEFTKSDSSNKR